MAKFRRLPRLSGLLAGLLLPLAAMAAPLRLAYLYSDGNVPGTLRAYDSLLRERPELRGQLQLTLLTESTFAGTPAADMLAADVLVLDTMNEQLLAQFNAAGKTDLVRAVAARGTVLGVGEGLQDAETWRRQGVAWDERARAYWTHSGAQNQLALMKLALSRAGVKGLQLPEPQLSLDFGYYYPDGAGGRVFADWAALDAWREAHGKHRPGAPRVAISFFKASFYSGDTALLDALVAEVEKQGGEAIPLFGYPGEESVERLLRDGRGGLHADVVLGGNFNFSNAETAARVEKLGLPVLNIITLYGRSAADWHASPTGLSSFEGTFNLAVPEFAGTIAPTVVGTKERQAHPASGLAAIVTQPIQEQVGRAVGRALRIARLRSMPNADKRIALLYYNYPPGKANIGASYLNVAESIANIAAALARAGYDVGGAPPDAARVLADITAKARNVGNAAPGELGEMLRKGDAVRVPVSQYRRWLDAYPAVLRAKMLKDWGDPGQGTLMTDRGRGEPALVVPRVAYGKLTLLPQPSRAWGEDLTKLYHARDLAPHHQYAATYAWLREGLKADAVVHMGTHGTLEWLDGKDVGLSPEDAPDALIADLPNIYVYNVDVVGEGLVARRRSEAQLVDHMVPPFRKGGLAPQLARLSELMNDHARNEGKNPQLAGTFARQAREEALALGVARELKLDPAREWSDEELHRVEDYLLELKATDIPYGLHAFGRVPAPEQQRETAAAIAAVDRSLLPEKGKVLAQEMQSRIAASGPRELGSLLAALDGRALPSGTGGEPLRNPDSYATGNNFYGIDPDKVPKPASWELGVKLADKMLSEHFKEHGRYPEKVSFVIWGDETMRHEGVIESQVFHLLGTKPVWNERGKVVGVQVIPRAQLKRPRVDIVIASAAEGLFSNVTRLMDEAVQKAKVMDEADNLVRKHYLATRAALIAGGRKPEEAERLAGVRIFDEPPGQYNLNTSAIVAASGSWDNEAGFANDYIRKMGHGYGNGYWGEPMEDVFRLALAGTEKIVHSSSTALYGALDNDDMYMYMGGLASAVRGIDGRTPELLIANTRDPGRPEMTTAAKFVGQELRSRYVNPTWIQGMQREGYAGAGEMRAFVEYLWGWDATAAEAQVVDDTMWQQTFEVYVRDSLNQGMKEFFERNSPFALQDILARMIETTRKGYWQADAATRQTLLREYVESVMSHGVNCTEVSCGNARLVEYILDGARAAGVAPAAVEAVQRAFERAMGRDVAAAARQLREFARANDAREQAATDAARGGRVPDARGATAPGDAAASADGATGKGGVRGYVMREQRRDAQAAGASAQAPSSTAVTLWFGGLVLALLLWWRWRNAHAPH